MGKVRQLHQARPGRALENLNRLTGLNFSRWPESLVSQGSNAQKKAGLEDRHQARKRASAD